MSDQESDKTGGLIPCALHQWESHQRLGSGQENPSFFQCVFVVQRYVG